MDDLAHNWSITKAKEWSIHVSRMLQRELSKGGNQQGTQRKGKLTNYSAKYLQ
jgi:hypothetical protein